jgi:predicted DsbA family dithiol-disulfide isomerase
LACDVLGWARAQLGDVAGGIALLRQALTDFLQAGTRVGITDVLTRLAEAQALERAMAQTIGAKTY